MIQAVIFDMDGLLIDTEPKWQEMEDDFLKKVGITGSPEHRKNTLGLRTIEMIRYYYHIKPWQDADFSKEEKEIEHAMKNYYLDEGVLMNGSVKILEFLREKKIPIAIASSSPMMLIDTFLENFKLQSYFRVKHSAESEEFGKPHPGVYITTARKLGIHPASCLAFEDSFNGLLAAKSAMMKAVVIPDPALYEEERFAFAELKLRSLEEFGEKEFRKLN